MHIKTVTLLVIALSSTQSHIVLSSPTHDASVKVDQLHTLQTLAADINRMHPLDDYIVTVPPFMTVSTLDIERFLSGIPAPTEQRAQSRKRKRQSLPSMYWYIQSRWSLIAAQQNKKQILTEASKRYLNDIRLALATAFKHSLPDAAIPNRAQLKNFIQDATQKKMTLIVRNATGPTDLHVKSVFPVSTDNLNQAITQVLRSYFSDDAIQQLLDEGSLPNKLTLQVILQSLIMSDEQEKMPIVSGVSCSHEPQSVTPGITSIESTFGQAQGVKDQSVAVDRYYVFHDKSYPIIANKRTRIAPNFDLMHPQLIANQAHLHTASTLDMQATQMISRATQLLFEHYQQPICLWFAKREHTIYLLNVLPLKKAYDKANYVDPRYIKKCKSCKAPMQSLTPLHEIVVLKNREQVILAPTIEILLDLFAKRTEPEMVRVGIVKEQPSSWSRAKRLLEKEDLSVVWTPEFDAVRSWIDDNKWPLVIDPQQQAMFQFKRRKGFCTLYHSVHEGVQEQPVGKQLSVLAEFRFQSDANIIKKLDPSEFFGGVHITHLFDLLRSKSHETATQALRTILFRLQTQMKRERITQKEHESTDAPYDASKMKHMQQMYDYIQAVATQVYQQLELWHTSEKDNNDDLQLLFIINILRALILQESSEKCILTQSFDQR